VSSLAPASSTRARFGLLHEYAVPVAALGEQIALVGQKAAYLASASLLPELAVPRSVVVDVEQARALLADEPASQERLTRALAELEVGGSLLAVRSSPVESLPGALRSELRVAADPEALTQALHVVLSSNRAASARAQRLARGMSEQPGDLGVLIQVFVAAGEPADFGAVVLTRDPERGTPGPVGEFQLGVGPEHVVSGTQASRPLSAGSEGRRAAGSLERLDPTAFAEIARMAARLEQHFGEPLELELVRAGGTLWLLQARPLELSPRALVKLCLEAIDDDAPIFRRYAERLLQSDLGGLIERELGPSPGLPGAPPEAPCLRGLTANPGVAVGVVVTDPARALARSREEPVILFRPHAVPEDVAAFRAAQAVVTSSGGLTCHAAVIARGLGLPAIVGCEEVRIDGPGGIVHARLDAQDVILREGDPVSVDAQHGRVYRGAREMLPRIASADLSKLAQELRKLRPWPLWAYGDPLASLRAKREASLDGILCPVSEVSGLPPTEGRECWLELAGDDAERLLPEVPPGWGVVVRGALEDIPWSALRRLSRLRPLGVHLTRIPQDPAPPIALDLAVVSGSVGASAPLSGLAPRMLVSADAHMLFAADSDAVSTRLGHARQVGVLCETKRSLEWVLRLALRNKRTPSSP
jgi:phosphohistidine swiveling domain-containing protein